MMKEWDRETADAWFAKVSSLLSLSEDGMHNGWRKFWFMRVRNMFHGSISMSRRQ
jgi:hypothetical protein